MTEPHPPDVGWQHGFGALRRWVDVRGSADPGSRVIAGGVAVGAWVADVRDQFFAGQLTPEQIQTLQALPGWRWDAKAVRSFSRGLSMLQRYAATHDLAAIPVKATIGHFRVGVWAAMQRAAYESGGLSSEQIYALEQVAGWRWRPWTRWDRGFSMLTDYVQAHGIADVPADVTVDDYPLGRGGGAPTHRSP